MLLAGVGLGLGAGYVIDRLAHTLPWFTSIGVFVGFGVALYAIYLETR
jgi:F0F1-type ATP synthase assembly protein I